MRKKKRSFKKWILLTVFLVLAAGGAYLGLKKGDTSIEVTVRTVTRGEITSMVTATGTIRPEVEVAITSEVPGEIVELPVRDGHKVQRGDLLVKVNPDTLEAQVKQQEAGLASTRASSAQRKAELLQAELDLKRLEDLHAKGFATQDGLEQSQTRLEIAKSAFESAGFNIERQEMQLKEANDQLAKASLFAPIDGTVVLLKSEIGDRVVGTGQFAGTEIMRVADLSSMEVRVDVSEADIVNITIGQEATVEVDALPDASLRGLVTEIANSAETTGQRSQEQLTTFAVKIRLDQVDERLRPGMTATADIRTNSVKDAVMAPLGSVVVRPRREVEGDPAAGDANGGDRAATRPANADRPSGQGGRSAGPRRGEDRVRVVFVSDGQVAQLRRVETGIADRDFMEIKSGLEEGEQVITGSYQALTRELKDASAIKIAESSSPRGN